MLSNALLRIKHMNPQLQAAIIQLHPDDADTMDEHFSAKVIKTNGQRPRAPGFLYTQHLVLEICFQRHSCVL